MSTEYNIIEVKGMRITLEEYSLKFDFCVEKGMEEISVPNLEFSDLRAMRDNINKVLEFYQEETSYITIKSKHYDKMERLKEANQVLTQLAIPVNIFNVGSHYVLKYNNEEIHYWPTTGKWRIPETGVSWTEQTRFLGGLLAYMKIDFREAK